MPKYKIYKKEEEEVVVSIETNDDGEPEILASKGDASVLIGYLSEEGKLILCEMDVDDAEGLGLELNDDHYIAIDHQ